jgi:hypothetical protein
VRDADDVPRSLTARVQLPQTQETCAECQPLKIDIAPQFQPAFLKFSAIIFQYFTSSALLIVQNRSLRGFVQFQL